MTTRLALVLSGGAARGAYEAGAYAAMIDKFVAVHGRPPRFDMLFGTSIGALHAVKIASEYLSADRGAAALMRVWEDIAPSSVYRIGLDTIVGWPRALSGGGAEGRGLVSTEPKDETIAREGNFPVVRAHVHSGAVLAVGVGAVQTRSGRTAFFVDTADEDLAARFDAINETRARRGYYIERTHLDARHASASSAIPVMMPPVNIDGEFYIDGGVRSNDPLQVACDLGATHVVGISTIMQASDGSLRDAPLNEGAPGFLASAGLILSAYLDGQHDLAALEAATTADTALIAPSRSIGDMAARYLAFSGWNASRSWRSRLLYSFLNPRRSPEAELASNLLFEPGFAKELLRLGYADMGRRWNDVHRVLVEGGA